MTSFKISNTLCPPQQSDNLFTLNLDGSINTFKTIKTHMREKIQEKMNKSKEPI